MSEIIEHRDESQILQQTFEKLISKVHQDGFRDGVGEGKARSFQKGFDQGYVEGFRGGFTQACFNGALRTLNSVRSQSSNTALEELRAPQKAMCQMCLSSTRQSTSLADVKAWQNSVSNDSELKRKYETVNKILGSDVIKIEN